MRGAVQSNLEREVIVVVHPVTGERREYSRAEYLEECRKARDWQRALENAIEVPK